MYNWTFFGWFSAKIESFQSIYKFSQRLFFLWNVLSLLEPINNMNDTIVIENKNIFSNQLAYDFYDETNMSSFWSAILENGKNQ